MTASSFMESRLWLAAGWVMLHFLWVGGAIGLLAAAGRLVRRSASPERRYAFALGCLAALAVAPVVIAACLLQGRPAGSSRPAASSTTPSPNPPPPEDLRTPAVLPPSPEVAPE